MFPCDELHNFLLLYRCTSLFQFRRIFRWAKFTFSCMLRVIELEGSAIQTCHIFSGPRSARDFKSPRHSNRPTAINQELLITIPNSGLILGLPWLCVATPFTPNLCRYMSQSLMTSYDHALKTVIVSCSPKAT